MSAHDTVVKMKRGAAQIFLLALVLTGMGFASNVFGQSGTTLISEGAFITGTTSVLGALSKGSGSFLIDHPLDPENKLLYHSFVESPDVKNLYDGIAVLDGRGEATIELPDYFLALNKDFRYLATPIGEPMPDLHLEKNVGKSVLGVFGSITFRVSGGVPNGRVSWQVTGIRHDPYIIDNPIIPEVDKGPDQPFDVGEYVCPECYE